MRTLDSAFGLRSCAADMIAVVCAVRWSKTEIERTWSGLMLRGVLEMKLQAQVAIRFFVPSLNFFREPCMDRLPPPCDSCQLWWGRNPRASANDSMTLES